MKNVKLTVNTDANGNGLVQKTMNAWIAALSINYTGTQACTVVVREVLSDGFTRDILTVSSANTDIHRPMHRASYGSANTATGQQIMEAVGYMIEVAVSGATVSVDGAVVVHVQCEGSDE